MDSSKVRRAQSLSSRDQGQWLQIQRNTFTNWVNESLRSRGIVVDDVRTDLADGVNLVALVEALTGRRVSGTVSRPANPMQKLDNTTVALDAIRADGVKIVNIDSSDIVKADLKLVLALVWSLVLRYQVGGMALTQHKAWLLAWLRAVIPECCITNFTTDWNDGIALHALLDFCKPGLSPNWNSRDKENRLENCQSAMKLARQHFNIPMVLRPDYLTSPSLDERSFITYMSYFTRVGGPGYDATLQRVATRAVPARVANFTTDWQDGQALVNLVRASGGNVDGQERDKIATIQAGLDAGQNQLGIEPLRSAKEIAAESTEHLGLMAYSAQYLRHKQVMQYSHNDDVIFLPRTVAQHNVTHNGFNGGTETDEHITTIKTANYTSFYSNKTSTSDSNHYHQNNGDVNHNLVSISNHHHDHHNNNYLTADGTHFRVTKGHYDEEVTKPLRVTTVYDTDDAGSTHASTIASTAASTGPPTFHLLRKSDVHAARVEAPTTDQLKVDVYSAGVIMDSKMTGTFDPEKLKVEAIAPTGRVIRITGDGQYAAPFTSDEIGRWQVSMYYDGRYMDGCPIDVCDPSQVKIHDLQGGHVGKPNIFHVDCTKAGPGDLGVDVTLNGRPVSTHISPTSTPGYFKVNFTPFAPGPYEVNVHFNRAEVREGDVSFFDPEERQRKAVFYTRVDPKPGYVDVKASCDWEVDYITGGPFVCHVTDATDISVYGMEDGTVCAHPELIADCTRVGEGHIEAEVTHHGLRYPCKVRKDKPCVYRVSFKPKGPGTYKVWVTYDGQPVKGSPFVQEIAELEKPTAHGDGLYRGVPGKPSTFTVDPRGFPGQVSVAVNGPSHPVRSELEPQRDNTIKATYYPNERGPHTVDVKLDGRNVDGSPYHPLIVDPVSVRVSGGWRPYLDEKGLIPLRVGKEKHLPFDVSEAGPGELTSEVQGPNGKIPVTIDARNDGKHSVIFTPREEGKHYIHVNWGGYPLHNSPYMGYASHEPELDDEYPNVRLVPIHLHSPTYPHSHPSSLGDSTVDGRHTPRDTGPLRQVGPQQQLVTGAYPGQGPVYLQYKDFAPSSPRSVSVYSINSQPKSPNGPQKVILRGRGLKEAEVDKPAKFQVDGTQANPGRPKAYLQGVKDQLPVSVEGVRPQVYECTYIPEKPGGYLLYVNWNDKPLRGSPFKVTVREPPKPHLVTATLDRPNPVVGEHLEMKIDPRTGGSGVLTARCIDPTGQDLPIQVVDNYDHTKALKVKPEVPGRHIVEIRYDDHHIKGSPFALDIKAKDQEILPVKVWGPGIESGVIPEFQSTFWVETTGAGAGDLRVRIMGPKGAFHVKMRKASQRDKIYQAFYDPIEPGVYMVHVEWSGVHVAGSPFQVILAMTERELRHMQEVLTDEANNYSPGHSAIDGGRNSGIYDFHNLSSSRSDLDNDVGSRHGKKKKSSKKRGSRSDIASRHSNDILY